MIDRENYIWFNQKYLAHKDTEFNQNGSSIEISINSNTIDFKTYSTPILNISIFNDKIRYNINLKYQNILDLLSSIKDITINIDDIYKNGGSEIKKIINNKNFKLGFKTSQNTGKRAVLILIANSATDFGIIVIPYNLFLTIVELFKSFKRNYIGLPFEISNRASLNYILDELKEIKEFNKSLPSSIVDLTSSKEHVCKCTSIEESTEEKTLSDSSNDLDPPWDTDNGDSLYEAQKNFENFMINNIDDIEVPELCKVSEKVEEEQKSFFIEDILKNDIKNLDSFITSVTSHSNPIEGFREIIGKYMNSTLPSITDEELKSACYYSKRFFLYNIQNYIRNHVPMPIGIPIIKYKPNEFDNENIDLAYDLLTLSMYIRLFKDKMITKIDDASINNSLLYISLRNYTDIFTFSFLDDINQDIIVKCVMKRFKSYSKKNVFKSFDELLKQYGFSEINEIEISNFTAQIIKRISGSESKMLNISDLHQQDYNEDKIMLPYSNDLSIDKIVNEFVKAEVEIKLNTFHKEKYSDEVLKILGYSDIEKNESLDNSNWFESIISK